MRVLVTWGSKHGGTEGIGRMLAEELRRHGHEVVDHHAQRSSPEGFDAVLIGGSIYANRWNREARRFIGRHVTALRRVPVWLFSSGPLDDSCDRERIEPTAQVSALMHRIGALGHATFGGRREHDGDWRNPAQIRAWAASIAGELGRARPGPAVDLPARAWSRWAAYAAVGALVATLPAAASTAPGVTHAILAPLVFTLLAGRYFRYGARDPLPTALLFGAATAVAGLLIPPRPIAGLALAVPLVVLVTWAVGLVRTTFPFPKRRAI